MERQAKRKMDIVFMAERILQVDGGVIHDVAGNGLTNFNEHAFIGELAQVFLFGSVYGYHLPVDRLYTYHFKDYCFRHVVSASADGLHSSDGQCAGGDGRLAVYDYIGAHPEVYLFADSGSVGSDAFCRFKYDVGASLEGQTVVNRLHGQLVGGRQRFGLIGAGKGYQKESGEDCIFHGVVIYFGEQC